MHERERSQTTPRRRRQGPKQPLPKRRSSNYADDEACEGAAATESPYYTIDNTEDIYGTTLLPSQRCYVDPWDLENYDYVRKKLDVEQVHSMTPSPTSSPYGYGMAATMPRPHTRHLSRNQCQLECCVPVRSRRKQQQQLGQQQLPASNRYDDYMATMTKQLHLDDDEEQLLEQELFYGEPSQQQQLYNGYGYGYGYGGFSSASSTEHQHSYSGGDDMTPMPRRAATLQRRSVPNSQQNNNHFYGYGTAPHPRRRRSTATGAATVKPQTPPHIDFPAPPPHSPAYDYCNPYATLPYCSLPDCHECQQQMTSLIYAAPSTLYGTLGHDAAGSPDSSLYSGIYSRKFGLSKKGLLQIDYSCSWNDLDRVMGRQF